MALRVGLVQRELAVLCGVWRHGIAVLCCVWLAASSTAATQGAPRRLQAAQQIGCASTLTSTEFTLFVRS
jgi:hypothetical protein